jgi:hypothetical protein
MLWWFLPRSPHLSLEAIMARTTCKLSLLVALSFFLAFSPAWADGNSLLSNCKKWEKMERESGDTGELMGWVYCHAKVEGVVGTIGVFHLVLPVKIRVCFPEGVTIGQNVRIVIKYLQDNPDQLHLPDADLIYLALHKAFPCK